ncbi:hypothetical protein [Fusobacterium nucleatum]|uniref:hypothetical protein n=1 Tax=Fusobacterium nucleatum TaxID=851 RepID=UPI0030CE0A1C
MADFNSHIITNAGRNLLARALAGEGKVLFTKAAFGDQKHSGNLREVTELKNKKLDLNVMNIRNDNGTAILTVQISNENVEQSFQTEEFGVYAKIEGDITEILYSYTTAVSADTFPNNRLGKTYESIQDIYMAISSDIEAEIYVRDGVIYLTRDIANQVYTETGLTAVGTLKGRNNLEADKQYLADNGHWYKNIGGNRTWEATSGTPDEQLIPITWKYLYESLNNKENQLIQNLNGILGQNNGEFPVEQAVAGNVYYFPRNQKYYYCLKSQTSRVSVPNADFEELSIYQNRKKLENLFKYESISNWQTIINCDGMNANIYLADKIMIQNIWYSFTKKIGKTRLYFPKQYKSPPFVTLTDNDTGAAVSNNLISVDWTTTTYVDVNNLQSGFTMLVIGVI